MQRLLIALLFATYSLNSHANCIDVVDLSIELPPQFTTNGDVVISYQYDLIDDQYFLSWQKGNVQSDWFGPFPFTMACETAAVRWENGQFMLLERGCGTFCWYVKIFHLSQGDSLYVPNYQRIERPLAFDTDRDLLAYYHSQNLIRVKNLNTGYEQEIRTVYECESYSGLCFSDVLFDGDTLLYTWYADQDGEQLSAELENELMIR